jgi:hypothetical protein
LAGQKFRRPLSEEQVIVFWARIPLTAIIAKRQIRAHTGKE